MSLNPAVNGIDWYEDSGTSSFNSMLAEVRHQFAHTFEADVQYRWAHSLDDGSGPYSEPIISSGPVSTGDRQTSTRGT